MAINNFDVIVETTEAEKFEISGETVNSEIRSASISIIKKLQNYYELSGALSVNLKSLPPRHSGFGSGTQLGLALAKSYCLHHKLNFSAWDLAKIIGRGARSGIGIGVFEQGGFIVDGGKSDKKNMPPIIVRKKFPENWKILLILDLNKNGLHGNQEITAIKNLPEFDKSLSSHLCYVTLLKVLPSLSEENFKLFASGLNEIQKIMGKYFSTLQGGSMFMSRKVADAMSYLETEYDVALGQSSWGPTGFAIFESEEMLLRGLHNLNMETSLKNRLKFITSDASNIGAISKVEYLRN